MHNDFAWQHVCYIVVKNITCLLSEILFGKNNFLFEKPFNERNLNFVCSKPKRGKNAFKMHSNKSPLNMRSSMLAEREKGEFPCIA